MQIELYIHQRILRKICFFYFDDNQKCFMSSKSAYSSYLYNNFTVFTIVLSNKHSLGEQKRLFFFFFNISHQSVMIVILVSQTFAQN